jgi:histidine triad (HIT) family protein
MENCVFCKILAGEIPSYKVYEDSRVFAFLDIHPINPGHVLVIPKEHTPDFYNVSDENYTALMAAVKKIGALVQEKMQPKKMGLMVMGWDVPHAHVHVVPMRDYHDITSGRILEGKTTEPAAEELANVAALLSEE